MSADEAIEFVGDERNVVEASVDLGSADVKIMRDRDGKRSVIVLASSGHALKVPADLLCDAC
jgi:hypothetical protein